MKLHHTLPIILLAAGLADGSRAQLQAQSVDDQLQVARSAIKADRQATVTEAMQLTEDEARAFWPIYHQYRTAMDNVGDGVKHLVIEYSHLYPNVPDERAKKMLKDLVEREEELVETRASYLKRIGKVLPAAKTLRFAQVESRLDLAVRLEMAAHIPLVPIEGQISGRVTEGGAYAEGVAGGIVVQTLKLTATVAAIDKANRKVTLVSPEGIKQTVKVGPEAINFDQIRVGDQLKVMATEELVVQMAGEGTSPREGAAGVVALAPKGAKPGGLMAETTQVTATVTAIDRKKRTATLRFEDGSTKTLPVRSDVDLGKRKVGEKVVFQVTEMIAISVEKP
jgi:hypothetical protein